MDHALELYATATAVQPDDPSLASDRAWAVEALLEIRARTGELSAAEVLRAHGDAVAARQAILDRAPTNPQFRTELAVALINHASRGIAAGESGTALGLADRAVALARALTAAAPDDLTVQKLLADALGARADALSVARDPMAAATAQEALGLARRAAAIDTSYDLDVACAAARVASLDPAHRGELEEQALAAIERLASAGASDLSALEQSCLAPLHGMPRWNAAHSTIAAGARSRSE
jgi:hypothetical protein